MARKRSADAELDEVIEEILVDAYGDHEQLGSFEVAFQDNVELPADAFVIGEPVSVVKIAFDGNERRGLTATVQRDDGDYEIALADVQFPEGSDGDRYAAAYRKWMGLKPQPQKKAAARRRHKATSDDLDLSQPVELVVLAVKERAARCRLLGADRVITLRSSRLWDVVPEEIATVKPRKQWRYGGHPYLSGDIESTRLDLAALDLTPLRLESRGTWDPDKEYWGEEGEPIDDWAKPIIARGPRPMFEMEQVLPGADPDDLDGDPIIEATELKAAGETGEARARLMQLAEADLRCLDAHAHLGNLAFAYSPKDALRHYQVGLRIGQLSLPDNFDGVLAWGWIDNRPFLRCVEGYGLCRWRLGELDEAAEIFERMLWLNPSDNQGIRGLLPAVRAGESWDETCE